ncbi:MAG: hypothetical protein ACRBF0_22515 [Calditrichia bacterium]
MPDIRKKLLHYFNEDLSQLKQKALEIDTETSKIGAAKTRSVYKWKLAKPILIFTHAEQIEFNDVPLLFTLKAYKTATADYEHIFNALVKLIGLDANGNGIITSEERQRAGQYISRIWCINKHHNNIQEYPPEGEGYIISLRNNPKECGLEITHFLNLFAASPP